jgi:hypothetical protein
MYVPVFLTFVLSCVGSFATGLSPIQRVLQIVYTVHNFISELQQTEEETEVYFLCCILFMVLTNRTGGVTVTQTNVFIIPLTTCFGPDRTSSGD